MKYYTLTANKISIFRNSDNFTFALLDYMRSFEPFFGFDLALSMATVINNPSIWYSDIDARIVKVEIDPFGTYTFYVDTALEEQDITMQAQYTLNFVYNGQAYCFAATEENTSSIAVMLSEIEQLLGKPVQFFASGLHDWQFRTIETDHYGRVFTVRMQAQDQTAAQAPIAATFYHAFDRLMREYDNDLVCFDNWIVEFIPGGGYSVRHVDNVDRQYMIDTAQIWSWSDLRGEFVPSASVPWSLLAELTAEHKYFSEMHQQYTYTLLEHDIAMNSDGNIPLDAVLSFANQ